MSARHTPFNAAGFLADLLAADLTALAHPSGKLELMICSDRPRHPHADDMSARFYSLSDSARASLSAHIRNLGK